MELGAGKYKFDPAKYTTVGDYFDDKEAQRAVNFFPKYLHINLDLPYELPKWQANIVATLYGWRLKGGTRKYRQLYAEIPRGNGKSMLMAGLATYELFCTNEPTPEVYLAACSRQQASVMFDYIRLMLDTCPELKQRCKPYTSSKAIEVPSTYGVLRVLSSDDRQAHSHHGSAVFVDELHLHPNDRLFRALVSGVKTRTNPLIAQITTAGNDQHGVCYQQHQYAEGVVNRTIKDTRFLPVLYCFDEKKDKWEDPKVWRRLNPNWGISINPREFEADFAEAQHSLPKQNEVRQLALNQWLDNVTSWIDLQVWDKGSEDLPNLIGQDCWIGLDLSSKIDLTAAVLCFRVGDSFALLPYIWTPAETIRKRSLQDKVPYDEWAKKGHMLTTEGASIREREIYEQIKSLSTIYNIRAIAYDRYKAADLVDWLSADGLPCVKFDQSIVKFSEPTKFFEAMCLDERILHAGHPVLRWTLGNVMIYRSANNDIKPHKGKSKDRIDPIVASIMAMWMAKLGADQPAEPAAQCGVFIL